MELKYSMKKMSRDSKTQKERRDYRMLSRQATAFERFAGEFADTAIAYQNVGGFIRPIVIA